MDKIEAVEERLPSGSVAGSTPWGVGGEGEPPELTPRQGEILALIARGRSNKEIAYALGIRERTVKFHVASLFEKLGTSSRTEALVVALKMGVVQIGESA